MSADTVMTANTTIKVKVAGEVYWVKLVYTLPDGCVGNVTHIVVDSYQGKVTFSVGLEVLSSDGVNVVIKPFTEAAQLGFNEFKLSLPFGLPEEPPVDFNPKQQTWNPLTWFGGKRDDR